MVNLADCKGVNLELLSERQRTWRLRAKEMMPAVILSARFIYHGLSTLTPRASFTNPTPAR